MALGIATTRSTRPTADLRGGLLDEIKYRALGELRTATQQTPTDAAREPKELDRRLIQVERSWSKSLIRNVSVANHRGF
jgi:hypothetical protein